MPELNEYILPIYWASYIINGDATSLGDGEQEEIDEYFRGVGNPHIVSIGDEYWFAHRNDANNLGGDVCSYYSLDESEVVYV